MGRLIDLDNLLEDMIYCNIGRKSLEEVLKVLNAQPTVETVSKWILCSESLPKEPDVNPIFEGKRLELYLVSLEFGDYPFRAFWNGRFFTDGWSRLDNVTAWMPLPKPYKGN